MSGGAPACADVESAVTGVLPDYRLDRDPALSDLGGMTMCFFTKSGGTLADGFSMSLTRSRQTAEQITRTRDYLESSKPGQVVDSPAAAHLNGYISEPLGDGNLALTTPAVQVAFIATGGAGPTRQQIVDTLVAIGTVLAH
ncbi:hypothetical protein [Prescottella subtropica]|uniref:hypothetical protein n=1 Tax=Prescottella subtropica TaxID=2545757 RepID=UPI0010F50EE1|nr:hypothetical protein [Prescottella subtropica]